MKGSIKMKKYLNISFVYAIAAMAGGVFLQGVRKMERL